MKYIVLVKEVWVQAKEVEANSRQEALQKVFEDEDVEDSTDANAFEYSHTLGIEEHSVKDVLTEPQWRGSLVDVLKDWMTSPINDHGTPHVQIPEDFTPEEQTEFVELAHADRFVSEDEQRAKLREIRQRRVGGRKMYRMKIAVAETESGPSLPVDTLVRIIAKDGKNVTVESMDALPDPGNGEAETFNHAIARVTMADLEEV